MDRPTPHGFAAPRSAGEDRRRLEVRFATASLTVAEHRCAGPPGAAGGPAVMARTSLGFVRRGLGVVARGRREVYADANQVVLFCGGDEYRVRPLRAAPRGRATVVGVGADLVAAASRAVLGRARKGRLWERLAVPRSPRMQLTFARLLTAIEGAGDPLAAEEAAFQLLCFALAEASGAPGCRLPGGGERVTARVQEVLAARFEEVLSLDELAREAHCSKFHLCRVFKATAGMPVYRYLHRLRLAEAVDRLLGGEDDLSRLAFDLGFSSHSHFTAVFRREMRITPSRFRDSLGRCRRSPAAGRRSARLPRTPAALRAGDRRDRRG